MIWENNLNVDRLRKYRISIGNKNVIAYTGIKLEKEGFNFYEIVGD